MLNLVNPITFNRNSINSCNKVTAATVVCPLPFQQMCSVAVVQAMYTAPLRPLYFVNGRFCL
jgi:uncharacterized protein (DUF697 family)